MANLQDAYDSKKGESTPLLKGSSLLRKQSSITLNVTGVRLAPDNFNSPAIMDFEPITVNGTEYGAIPLNKTNTKALMEIVGDIDLDDIRGKATFMRVMVNNPQTKALAQGLQLTDFIPSRGKPKLKKQKAGPASRRGGKQKPIDRSDEDVPF